MAIEITASQIAHDGNGITTVLHTNFPILDGVDVWEEDLASGILTRLENGTHYTWQPLTVNAQVTAVTAPATGKRWHLMRATRPVQPVRLPSEGKLPTERVERTLDRGAMAVQEMQREQARTLSAPITEPQIAALPRAVDRAGRLLTFDDAGQPAASAVTMEQIAQVIDGAYIGTTIAAGYKWVADGAGQDFDLPDEWAHMTASTSLLLAADTLFIDFDAYTLGGGVLHMLTAPPRGTVIVGRNNLSVAGGHAAVAEASAQQAQNAAVQTTEDREAVASDRDVVTAARAAVEAAYGALLLGVINVRVLGAVGDGIANDSAAIQAAIDEAQARGGGTVYLPRGTYRIQASQIINNAGHVNLTGDGANATTIVMYTANTKIFRFAECGAGRPDFHVSGLTLEWAVPALPAHTNAVGLAFEAGGGNPAFGYYNFSIRDVTIRGCHTGVSNRFGATPPNLWGCSVQDLRVHDFAARAWDVTNVATGGGSPNASIRNAYLIGRAGLVYTSSVIFWDCGDAYEISGLELNNISMNGDTGIVYLGGSRAGSLGPVRFEGIAFVGGTLPALVMAETHYITLQGAVVAASSVAAGVVAAVLRVGAGALATIRNLQVEGITGAGLLTGALETAPGQVLEYVMVTPDAGSWLRNGGYSAPRLEMADGFKVATNLTVGAAGTLSMPALAVGPAGNGISESTDAWSGEGTGLSLSVSANGGQRKGLLVMPAGAANVRLRPSAPDSSTSNGRTLMLSGGAAGALSGAGGAISVNAGPSTDGNGSAVNINAGFGVGTNRTGGAVNINAGTSTGTAEAGGVTIQTGVGPGTASVVVNARTTGNVIWGTDNVFRWGVQGSASGIAGALTPIVDNAYRLGSSIYRVTEVYAVSGAINTSDEREKDIIQGAFPFGLDFVMGVAPIAYRWKEARKVVVGRRQVGEVQIGERVTGQRDTGQTVDEIRVERGDDGRPHVRVVQTPVMEDIVEPIYEPVYEPVYEAQPGARIHLSWSAQQVRETLGSGDYAVWTLDDPADPQSRQGLRPDQMTAILWQAFREHVAATDARLSALSDRLAQLEGVTQ